MNILVFGANGDVGSRVVNEALSRNHSVHAVIRNKDQISKLPENVTAIVTEVSDDADLVPVMEQADTVISALRPPRGSEPMLVPLTRKILSSARLANTPIVVVGGAAILKIPGKTTTVLTEPGFLPSDVVPIATACQQQSLLFEDYDDMAWSYLCPPAMLLRGTRTGEYRLGSDTLVTDKDGISQISMEDFAVALVDEAEQKRHNKRFFTVAY
ncbi:NAD(P)-dependent oxidoreductase [Sneathiella glossodoripedis]|uniref:NAD(P)-dependent oxidoreductase n=1 Tax=Sneathiella glossodoripedis TaxID=418853 RepID=UPI00046FAB74|nr:NAD(P)H-binding protein [Sneathiella glossodoripedis]